MAARIVLALLVGACSALQLQAQRINGAWKLISVDGKSFPRESTRIFSDGYFMSATHTTDGAFEKAAGGTYSISGKEYTEIPDFNTADTAAVRKPAVYSIAMKGNELTLTSKSTPKTSEVWTRIDDGKGSLSGAWRFGARVNDDGTAGERRPMDSPRQTMKILSGNHFQWAAFNHQTKEFSGTGGGTYVLKDGKYTETIRFFSRDNARAGMSLTFDCRVDGTDWYHKGKGMTGNPVSEVWEKVR